MQRKSTIAAVLTMALVLSACGEASSAADGKALEESVVRISGTACLSPILASGVVVGPELVVTVAHAVAGAEDDLRVVSLAGTEYQVAIVGFDPDRDIALLTVDGLTGSPLSAADAAPDDVGVIAAVNRDQDLEMIDYRVLRVVNARSGDIYDEGHVERTALDVQSEAAKGTSGAPLVDGDGSYVGIVFATSNDREDGVYALAASEITAFLGTVDQASVVDRGKCR